MIKKQRIKTIALMLFLMILLLISVIGGRGKLSAFADSKSNYTDVISDLRQDISFKMSAYPEDKKDYSLSVIQIAESTEKELFVYVYQPCASVKKLVATDINMSLTDKMGGIITKAEDLSEADKPKLYSLKLISYGGVFQKYVVNGFEISSAAKRYYNIASIYRSYDEDLDSGSKPETVIDKKAFEVGKLYMLTTDGDELRYECQKLDTVQILNPFADFLEYSNGFKLNPDWCRSHYIAFSTDKRIDELIEADVTYSATPCSQGSGIGYSGEISRYDDKTVYHERETIDNEMTGGTAADGWFAVKHEWQRIESVTEFKANEDLNDETIKQLNGKQWVIRFTETPLSLTTGFGYSVTYFTAVENVSILRLKFVTDGDVYNLGAISDAVHEDQKPGNSDNGFDFWSWLAGKLNIPVWAAKAIVYGVGALIILGILLPILSAIFPVVGEVLKAVFKGLLWLITAPFKGIAWLIKKIKGDI